MSFPNKNVNIKHGYKAVSMDMKSTNDLSCGNQKKSSFFIGQWLQIENNKKINPASNGFHYCEYLSQVMKSRPFEGKINRKTGEIETFRYFRVEAGKIMVQDFSNKDIATESIKLVKELSENDIEEILAGESKIKSTCKIFK